MLIFGARNVHLRRMWCEKQAPKTGARKWSGLMAVSAAYTCVCHGFTEIAPTMSTNPSAQSE